MRRDPGMERRKAALDNRVRTKFPDVTKRVGFYMKYGELTAEFWLPGERQARFFNERTGLG